MIEKHSDFWVILKSGDTCWKTTAEDVQCTITNMGLFLLQWDSIALSGTFRSHLNWFYLVLSTLLFATRNVANPKHESPEVACCSLITTLTGNPENTNGDGDIAGEQRACNAKPSKRHTRNKLIAIQWKYLCQERGRRRKSQWKAKQLTLKWKPWNQKHTQRVSTIKEK